MMRSPAELQGRSVSTDAEATMDSNLFARLRTATERAAAENELPDFLAARLLAVADNPRHFPGAAAEVRELLEMLPLYDTYGQTGYIGMGVSNLVLEGALKRLEAKRR